MKRNLLTFICTFGVIAALFLLNQPAMTNAAGADAGHTGSPGDKADCTSCHTGTATTISGWITSNIPSGGYTAGQTYTITATATAAGVVKFGFQASPQNTTGKLLGTLILTNTTETELVGSGKYIDQKSAGTTGSGSRTWTFNWKAPVAGTGDVTFYGAFNCSNNNDSKTGDKIFLSTLLTHECTLTDQITTIGATTFCTGGSVLLDAGSGFAGYNWSNGQTTQTISPTASGNYNVSVKTTDGCSATTSAVNVTVNALPATPVITANGALTFCEGGTVALNAGTGYNTYHWSTGATTQTIAVTSSGDYKVTVSNSSGCTATSAAVTVTVNPLPAIPVITVSGATIFCNGGNVALGVSNTYNSYIWSNVATTASINVNTTGNYTVNVTNSSGCSATSAAQVVTVNPLPALKISGTSTICTGGRAALNAGNNFAHYIWSTTDTTSSISIDTAGTFAVTVTNAFGCTATGSLAVSISTSLTPTIVSGATTFCQGDSVLLNAGLGFATYLWSTGQTTQSIVAINTGLFTISVTDTGGCAGAAAINIMVNDTPVVNMGGLPSTICQGSGTIIKAIGDTAWAYTWNPGNEQGSTLSVILNSSTTYTLTATDTNGCRGRNNTAIIVTPLPPVPTITQRADTLIATDAGMISGQWLLNDSLIAGATSNIMVAGTRHGHYVFIVTGPGGCTSTSLPFNYVSSGVVTLNSTNAVYLFPNPFNNYITIQGKATGIAAQLINVEGQIIINRLLTGQQQTLNTSTLPAGIYLLKVKFEGGVSTQLMFKE